MSKLLIKFTLPLLMLSSLLSMQVRAEERWVADSFFVPMRTGESMQHRIISNLRTGTRLTLVSENAQSGWSKVQTQGGTVGFVQNQHLMNTPTANQRLAQVQAEIDKLKLRNKELSEQLASAREEEQRLSEELNASTDAATELQTSYTELQEISEGAVNLNERHQQLLHDHQLIQTELDVVKAENARLQGDSRNTFFVYGAGAVLLGVIIAIILPRVRFRRGYSEWAN